MNSIHWEPFALFIKRKPDPDDLRIESEETTSGYNVKTLFHDLINVRTLNSSSTVIEVKSKGKKSKKR